MSRHTSRNVGLAAMVAAMLASGVALANPEAGGNISQKLAFSTITSTNAAAPTILTTVVVRCPAAGFLIANAEASFQLGFPIDSTSGSLFFGISRNSMTADINDGHSIESENPGTFPGSIQRFDSCAAGQSVTYRFVSFIFTGLTQDTTAIQPRLSAIFLRDHD